MAGGSQTGKLRKPEKVTHFLSPAIPSGFALIYSSRVENARSGSWDAAFWEICVASQAI
jgi:hypothetical protein